MGFVMGCVRGLCGGFGVRGGGGGGDGDDPCSAEFSRLGIGVWWSGGIVVGYFGAGAGGGLDLR